MSATLEGTLRLLREMGDDAWKKGDFATALSRHRLGLSADKLLERAELLWNVKVILEKEVPIIQKHGSELEQAQSQKARVWRDSNEELQTTLMEECDRLENICTSEMENLMKQILALLGWQKDNPDNPVVVLGTAFFDNLKKLPSVAVLQDFAFQYGCAAQEKIAADDLSETLERLRAQFEVHR